MSKPEEETSANQPNQRRDFIVGSAIAAGTAATIGIASKASAQEWNEAVERPQVLTASFDAKYRKDITLDDVWKVLEQCFGICGCPTCGLSGFDINLTTNPHFASKTEVPAVIQVQQKY